MSAPVTQPVTTRTRKRRPIVAFALATLAVGGVGAALTSAAWTDNVFATAPAEAATFDLQASLDGATWQQSDKKDAVELVVPAATFAKLLPGQTRTATLHVKNFGNVSAAVAPTVEWAASTFVAKPTAKISEKATTLSPTGTTGDTTSFTLTVTAPADWKPENKGKTGTIVVTFAGEAVS